MPTKSSYKCIEFIFWRIRLNRPIIPKNINNRLAIYS